MPKITISTDVAITVVSRNVPTGNDGPAITIDAGQSAAVDIDDQNQVSISLASPSAEGSAAAPHLPTVSEEVAPAAAELRNGSDEEVVAIMKSLPADSARTVDGYFQSSVVNQALAAAGIKAILADRRNTLSDANDLVAKQ